MVAMRWGYPEMTPYGVIRFKGPSMGRKHKEMMNAQQNGEWLQ